MGSYGVVSGQEGSVGLDPGWGSWVGLHGGSGQGWYDGFGHHLNVGIAPILVGWSQIGWYWVRVGLLGWDSGWVSLVGCDEVRSGWVSLVGLHGGSGRGWNV